PQLRRAQAAEDETHVTPCVDTHPVKPVRVRHGDRVLDPLERVAIPARVERQPCRGDGYLRDKVGCVAAREQRLRVEEDGERALEVSPPNCNASLERERTTDEPGLTGLPGRPREVECLARLLV